MGANAFQFNPREPAAARGVYTRHASKNPQVPLSAFAAALLVFAATALAEHEVDHRYEVTGHVLDAERRPLGGVPVEVRKDGQFVGGDRTDGEGRYSVRLHLHDDNIGESLAVRAGQHQAQVRVQAEHGNKMTARVHYVNFVGGEVSEKDLSGFRVPAWAYLVAAPFVIWAALHLSDVMGRRLRKLRAANAPAQPGEEKKRKGRRRR